MSGIVRCRAYLMLASTGVLAVPCAGQPIRVAPMPPATPGRVVVVVPQDSADGWIPFIETVLEVKCIWQSRIAPTVAVFDLEEWGHPAKLQVANRLPWFKSTESDGHATLQDPCSLAPGTNDPFFPEQWYLKNTGQHFGVRPGGGQHVGVQGADARIACAWNITTGNDKIAIAVIDNGVDGNHPDLFPSQIWHNKAEEDGATGVDDDKNGFIDDKVGWDFYDRDNDPLFLGCPDPKVCPDPSTAAFTHGTAVAGVIAARSKNAFGVAGVATSCRIMSLKISGDDWNAGYPGLVHILQAMDYAGNNGAKVVNCSFVYSGDSAAMRAVCQAMGQKGTLVVAAAGNDGLDIGIPANYVSPAIFAATLDNVITVGGCFAHDEYCAHGACSYSSNFSPSVVSLAAPGHQLWSTDRVLGAETSPYTLFGGTSGATPVVAGVAGLVISLHPTWTPGQVKQRLMQTVRVVPAMKPYVVTGGVVNAAAAVETVINP